MNQTLVNFQNEIDDKAIELDDLLVSLSQKAEIITEHAYKAACIEHAGMTQTRAHNAWLNYKASL